MGRAIFAKSINKAVFPGLQGGPHMHTIAAKAVALKEAMADSFKTYAQAVVDNAKALSSALQEQGFAIVSGGTDSHLMVVDLRAADITGAAAQECLDSIGITVNKNTLPFDPQPPTVCSAIRLGTPAITTRGMGVAEMRLIAGLIKDALSSRDDSQRLASIRDDVKELAGRFPLYKHRLVRS
jgi:glycine hydroxymethyltransferase